MQSRDLVPAMIERHIDRLGTFLVVSTGTLAFVLFAATWAHAITDFVTEALVPGDAPLGTFMMVSSAVALVVLGIGSGAAVLVASVVVIGALMLIDEAIRGICWKHLQVLVARCLIAHEAIARVAEPTKPWMIEVECLTLEPRSECAPTGLALLL